MFIVSKANFMIKRGDGTSYQILKDYIGEIPEDVAGHWLVKAAIKSGMISTPSGHSDRQMEQADARAEHSAASADIRPDAKAGKKTAKE